VSAEPVPLRLVNPETGEWHEHQCPDCEHKNNEIAGFQATIRSQAGVIGKLKRNHELERKMYSARSVIEELFAYWIDRTGRSKKCKLTAKRFDAMRERLDEGYEPQHMRLAIDYAAAFPYVVNSQRSPTGAPEQKFDDLTTIAGDGARLERWANFAARFPKANDGR
jgi:hypothetical protein